MTTKGSLITILTAFTCKRESEGKKPFLGLAVKTVSPETYLLYDL